MNLNDSLDTGVSITKLNGHSPDFLDILMNPAIIELYRRSIEWREKVMDKVSAEFSFDPFDDSKIKLSHVRAPSTKKIMSSQLIQRIMSNKLGCNTLPHMYGTYMDADVLVDLYDGSFFKKCECDMISVTDFGTIRIQLNKAKEEPQRPDTSLIKTLDMLKDGSKEVVDGKIESKWDEEIINHCPSHMMGYIADIGVPKLRYNLVNR